MSCDCQCQKALEQLSEENKTTQKALTEIRIMMEQFTTEKKQYWKDETARQRERTW
jgi:hypothetical protein